MYTSNVLESILLSWDDFNSVTSAVYDNQDVKNRVKKLDKDKYEEEKTFKECEIAACKANTEWRDK